MSKVYTPIIKDKGFNPHPVAGNIPYWADGRKNPNSIGSRLHTEFWEEQIHYCLDGYNTGGLFIPPRYYHYLNFGYVDGVSTGAMTPYFVDLHYELFMDDYNVRKDPYLCGMVLPKKRRAGLSFFGVEQLSYGMRFIDSYRAGVGGGLETYVAKFKSKLYRSYNETPIELMLNHLQKGDVLKIGYEYETNSGWQTELIAEIMFETMKDDPAKLEGEFFHDVILEESGEFPLAEQAIISIQPALKDGDQFGGMIYVYGTGGDMKKGGKTFSNIWHKHEHYSLARIFIPGERYVKQYCWIWNSKKNIYEGEIPNLKKEYPDLSPEQLYGCEDVVKAKESLRKAADAFSRLSDKSKYIQHKQNYPDKVEDVFTSSGSNNFNTEALFMQNYAIESMDKKYSPYELEWERDSEGKIVEPLAVKMVPITWQQVSWKTVYILNGEIPQTRYKNLDIVGIDSYDVDQTQTSDSLGGICVIRNYDELPDGIVVEQRGVVPILIYYSRPPRKEQFWELGLKVSVLVNAVGDTMIGADADAIIGYYKSMPGGRKYLSPRPKSFESADSKQIHEYGYKNTGQSAPRMLSLMQTTVNDNYMFMWFEALNLDLISYDEDLIGTDKNDRDLADAYGHALIRKSDRKAKNKTKEKDEEDAEKEFTIYKSIENDSEYDDIKKILFDSE